MKSVIKVLWVTFLAVGALFFVSTLDAEAASEKVYKEYHFPGDESKFPIKLSNGLTIDKAYKLGAYVPVVKKGSKVIWQGESETEISTFRFTVTKNNDTYLFSKTGISGMEMAEVIGVNTKGKVFLQKEFNATYEGVGIELDFISASVIEVAIEEWGADYNGSSASKFSGEYNSKFYQLYTSGKTKELTYIDKAFTDAVKKGQLKWTPGAIGTTYKTLSPKLSNYYSHVEEGELQLLQTWKATYGFNYGSSNHYVIQPAAKVRIIFHGTNVYAQRKVVGPILKKYLGAPFKNYNNEILVYKVGKNYLNVRYNSDGTAYVELSSFNYFY